MVQELYGAIEAGGTKFICAVGSSPQTLSATERIPTTTPEETIGRCIGFFRERMRSAPIRAIGVSCFGPLDLDPTSATFGAITSTPKPGWSDIPIRAVLAEELSLPVAIDTDVNGAVLAEHVWGAGRDVFNLLYLTIGTGIGGGAMVNGELVHGLVHPEMGHYRPRRHPQDQYEGCCAFHHDCLEGLASGPAIAKRWNCDPRQLPPQHLAWELESHYLAEAVCTFIFTLSPQRVILGGGVMDQDFLFPMIRRKVFAYLSGYVHSPAILESIDSYIVPQGLGGDAGILGAIALARRALATHPTATIGH